MARLEVYPNCYWRSNNASPERIDDQVLKAHEKGLTPVMYFHYFDSSPRRLCGLSGIKLVTGIRQRLSIC